MSKLEDLLIKLIKYQKIPCTCACKDGIERVSLGYCHSAIIELFKGCVPEKKEYLKERGHVLPDIDVIMENKFRSCFNECRTQTLKRMEEK